MVGSGDAADGERALLERVRGGDRKALDRLLERYQPRVLQICRRLLRDPEDAREAGQDALLGLARGIPGFRGAAALSTWVYAIARSCCLRRLRRSKFAPAAPPLLDHDALDALVDPDARGLEELLSARERALALARALADLDPADREVVVLAAAEGLRTAEIAARCGLSVAAVKARLHRARQALRRRLDRPVAPVAGPG